MNNPLSQALHSLIPTTNTLPPPLLDLATSLLAQSNHKASTLKADEEIARPYACAHLACDRLKITLNLPPIEARPPVPPRIYKRLYNHLDNILPQSTPSSRRIRTPSAKVRAERDELFSRSLGRTPKTTPGQGREKTLGEFRGVGTPSRRGSQKRDGLPPWIRPTLRYLCAQLGTGKIAPTVIAGIDSIVVPHGRRTDDEWVWGHLTGLLASLYLYVWNSVSQTDGVDEERYIAARASVIDALTRARTAITVKDVDAEEVAWEGWTDVEAKDVDEATLRISRYGWLESDWARGIQDLIQREEDADEDTIRAAVGRKGKESADAGGRVRRGDVMFQEKYDYLSERKRKTYAVWKEGILRRIEEIGGGDAMDVD